MNTRDYNFLLYGYSAFWLIILYIIGGYFGKYVFRNSLYKSFPMKISYLLIYFLSSFFSEIYIQKKRLFISYLSPTIFFSSNIFITFFFKFKN